ncbi:hypothetical protein J6590_079981 [Homalodisca vitripennis]|nr:hypothetical protein J6590_079981 [Homalodisca vitripennis]
MTVTPTSQTGPASANRSRYISFSFTTNRERLSMEKATSQVTVRQLCCCSNNWVGVGRQQLTPCRSRSRSLAYRTNYKTLDSLMNMKPLLPLFDEEIRSLSDCMHDNCRTKSPRGFKFGAKLHLFYPIDIDYGKLKLIGITVKRDMDMDSEQAAGLAGPYRSCIARQCWLQDTANVEPE